MALRTVFAIVLCVPFLGCGLEGPVPAGKETAERSPSPTTGANATADNPPPSRRPSQISPLSDKDAPYIQGKVIVVGPCKDTWITAGFVGKGADGKRYSIGASADLTPGSNSAGGTGIMDLPSQATSIFENGPDGPGYRHVKMPPGDYLVFLAFHDVMLNWKRVAVKPGDQLTVDLTFDVAKTGSVEVTWPVTGSSDAPDNRPLLLVPVELDGSDLLSPNSLPTVLVKGGKTTLANVPAGKYHVRTWGRGADVEVTPGNETRVTLK